MKYYLPQESFKLQSEQQFKPVITNKNNPKYFKGVFNPKVNYQNL